MRQHTLGAMVAMTLLLVACGARAQQTSADAEDVAARVGNRVITVEELDRRWAEVNPGEQAEAQRALYEGRRVALDGILAQEFLEAAAEASGVSLEQLLQDQTAARVREVTDAEVVAFFNANRNGMQGRPLEGMRTAIRRFLEEQQVADAQQAFIDELRAAGPPVDVLLEVPRLQVALSAADPVIGNPDAPVTIVEFSDFQCPFCAAARPTLEQLQQDYGDDVRLVWKDFPLTQIHPEAFRAAEAAQCAFEQDRFWEYHDQLFGNQAALDDESLKGYAAAIGLEAQAFDTCLVSSRHADRVRAGIDEGTLLGVTSTPTVLINGRFISGAQPYEVFAAMVDEELERANR